ncbi:serine--tRNA ligase [Candidatus Microgenomates bacterium]|nr:MAG: serine--tRNA ligase [Candidatus Microgenomates bacterium]
MLDIKVIRENPIEIQNAVKNKGINLDISKVLEADRLFKELSLEVQKLREEKNKFAKERNIEKGKQIKEELDKKEEELKKLEKNLNELLLQVPNPAKSDVKVGKDETENDVIRKYSKPKEFSFKPKDHIELGEALDIIDVKRAVKVSGARFYYLKNEAVLLEFALVNLAHEILAKEGFSIVIPPVLIKKEIMQALGYTEFGQDENIFYLPKDELFLVGTSEQSVVPMFKDEILNGKDFPKRYAGFSTCFRREAGSYGKDTRGILRVHQFDKLEMVSFVKQGEDDKEHEFLLSLEEKFFQLLDIPYQVIKMCTGDLGFPAARKYDIEAWIPSQGRYREVTSTSTTTDFQARRLNIKYNQDNERKFVTILNGTGFAIGRTIIAILENYQREDGSVLIPEALTKYLPFTEIKVKTK